MTDDPGLHKNNNKAQVMALGQIILPGLGHFYHFYVALIGPGQPPGSGKFPLPPTNKKISSGWVKKYLGKRQFSPLLTSEVCSGWVWSEPISTRHPQLG